MKIRRTWVVVIFSVGLVLFVIWVAEQPEREHAGRESTCDSSLWEHVYRRERLRVIEPCKVVEGRVRHIQQEADGDLHIRLAVEDKSLLTENNFSFQHGDLVVEVICVNPPTSRDAIEACRGFTQSLPIPTVGDSVRVIGAYVLDKQHSWTELHPVTQLELLR